MNGWLKEASIKLNRHLTMTAYPIAPVWIILSQLKDKHFIPVVTRLSGKKGSVEIIGEQIGRGAGIRNFLNSDIIMVSL